jgi:hypothetical protein
MAHPVLSVENGFIKRLCLRLDKLMLGGVIKTYTAPTNRMGLWTVITKYDETRWIPHHKINTYIMGIEDAIGY